MIQNDMHPNSKIEINEELCCLDKLVPYLSLIYENLYNVLESNRIDELKIAEHYFMDENFCYLI